MRSLHNKFTYKMYNFGIDISNTEYICRHANRTMAQTPRNDLDPHLWTRRKMPREMPTCKTDDESLEEVQRYGNWPRAKHNVYDDAQSTVRVMTPNKRRKLNCQCKQIKFDHNTGRGEYACTCNFGEMLHAASLTCISSKDYDVCKKGICACE